MSTTPLLHNIHCKQLNKTYSNIWKQESVMILPSITTLSIATKEVKSDTYNVAKDTSAIYKHSIQVITNTAITQIEIGARVNSIELWEVGEKTMQLKRINLLQGQQRIYNSHLLDNISQNNDCN